MRLLRLSLAPFLAAMVLGSPAQAATVLGNQQIEPVTDSNAAGLAEAYRTTASASGSLARLTVYVDATSTATTLVAGLYADAGDRPGALLAQGSLAAPIAGAWNDVTVPSASVTAGSTYWIAVLGPVGSGTLRYRDRCCGGGTPAETSAQADLSSLPSTWSTGVRYTDGPISAYGSSADGPVLLVTPSSLSFGGVQGGPNPASQTLSISNGGAGILDWSAAASPGWLSVFPASGVGAGTTQVSASTAGLGPGTYAGTVTVTAAGAEGSPKTVNVTLTVTAPGDTTPPTVSITAPSSGATVSGTISVAANAADNVGVAGVQFRLDGANLGAEDTSAPYAVSWNTTGVANGSHTLTAIARDAAGNQTTAAPVTVTVNNTGSPSPGLVAAYGFNEPSGATVADASGQGNAGTVSGATRTASGRYGAALTFDGVNDWVNVPDAASLDLTTGMTLEAWVYPAALSQWRTVLIKEQPGNLVYALYANSDTNRPSGHVFTAGNDFDTRGTAQLGLNTWTHLAATYDGSTLRLYVNGAQASSLAVSGAMPNSASPLRFGGNAVWGEWFSGRLDEIRLYNRALSAVEVQSDMATPVGGTPPPPDTTPPTVSITAPAQGATVSGTISVAANAADNVGVAGVQFRLDGANLGAEDTSAPYSVSWNTTQVTNGSHTLSAIARDPAGNQATAAPVTVTVNNSGSPDIVGSWSAPIDWPLVPVHMMLLRTGKVLMFDGFQYALGSEREWDPATGTFTTIPYNRNLFCAGHVALADGRALIVGGHVDPYIGLADTTIWDPVGRSWRRAPDMARSRWYPTATMLPDGRVLVVSGDNIVQDRPGQPLPLTDASNTLPEIYDPVADYWTQLPSASRFMPLYPFMFVLPNGRVADAGPDLQTRTLDLVTNTWTNVATSTVDGHSAVMYEPGKILKSGTWSDPDYPGRIASGNAAVIDMNAATPSWRGVAPMAFGRSFHTLTVLPDGNVLATGGGSQTDGVNTAHAVFAAELWNATNETWTTMASAQRPRLYHSSALLLPDGRVLVAGGGRLTGFPVTEQLNAEIYSPPYLFKGPRPTIASAPATLTYGNSFTVTSPDAAGVTRVNLVRLGSVTHNIDMDQRFQTLSFTRAGNDLTVQAPANANLAPPGNYMIFLVNSNGVPSVASFTRLPVGAGDSQPPTVPANLTASGGVGAASLAWNASTDNVAVTRYNVHRSTTAGFVPSSGNRIAQPTGTSYTNTGLAAGTYYFKVTAEDAAGNISAPSNEASATVTAPTDTVPPTVSITAPSAGATVSGTVTVAANASDNVGVVGVQFRLDGANLGAEDTSAPYSISWNTTQIGNGAHSLTAVARDAAGNSTTSASVGVTVNNVAPGGGLVAAYGFNETSGATVTDGSGQGNAGTISGATRTASGRYGRALTFDGVNDWVTVADSSSLDLTTAMTLEAWVYPTALSQWRTVLIKEQPGDLVYALYANTNTNRPSGHVFTGGNDLDTRGTAQLPLNAWRHLAATYDGTTLRLYVNGVQVSTRAVSGAMPASSSPLRFGGNAVWGEWFSGRLDEIRLYNRALSAAEVQNDMNTPVAP